MSAHPWGFGERSSVPGALLGLPHPAPARVKHMTGVTQDNWITSLSAVRYVLKLSRLGLGCGTRCQWVVGRAGGSVGTQQLSSHLPVCAEPV